MRTEYQTLPQAQSEYNDAVVSAGAACHPYPTKGSYIVDSAGRRRGPIIVSFPSVRVVRRFCDPRPTLDSEVNYQTDFPDVKVVLLYH